jgi:DNA-binding Lrp family transcriptional regulator
MDDVDRRIVAALQIDGRASWRQIGQLAGVSESTAARHAQRLFEEGLVRVTAVADPARCGLGQAALIRLACEVGATRRVSHQLAERADVRFVALVTGGYDLVLELIVPSRTDLADFLIEDLTAIEGVRQSATSGVIRNFSTTFDWSRSALGGRAAPRGRPPLGHDAEPVSLDETDFALIRLLADDGRASFADLSDAVGLTESTTRRRAEALIERRCLHIATLVAPPLVGYDVEVMAWLRVDLSELEKTAEALAALPEVRYLSGTYGTSNLVLEAFMRSNDDLYAFLTDSLGSIPAIKDVELSIELETVKRAHLRMDDSHWRRPRAGAAWTQPAGGNGRRAGGAAR